MGNCRFCGEPVGILRSTHKECFNKFETAKVQILDIIVKSFHESHPFDSIDIQIKNISNTNFINQELMRQLIIKGWENFVEKSLDDGVLTKEEENWLSEYAEYFKLNQNDLNDNDYYTKFIQGSVLREILNGNIPERVNIEGQLPFNLKKGEKIVWVFQNVRYLEQKTAKQYAGGYAGVSIKIAKGVYYRTGGFKGRSIETPETVQVDSGILCLTQTHIYFSGGNKNFRIPYDKIVSFTPYSDGIGIQKDSVTSKPQAFITGDGWFIYNLLTNISKT
jgi:hypothetical protein